MSKGQIIEVDPSTLTIAVNVRRDVKLDKEFVASIKQHGVLQPPMVVKTDAGYEVVIGQRRTLAAAQAKLPKIEAYLVDRAEADAARIVDQLTENEQRQQLSDAERVGGYKELALIGVTPAEIAKRTATPRDRVDRALAVAGSEVASAALQGSQLTLDQAAEIVEFQDDKAAVKRLTEVAESNPRGFAHVVQGLRSDRAVKEAREKVEAEIAAAGAELLKATDYDYGRVEGWSKLASLGTVKDATVPLEREAVAVEMLGGRALRTWRDGQWVYEAQWLVRDGHDFPNLGRSAAESSPEQIEREERRAAEQKARDEARAARVSARDVRLAWVRDDLLQRKTLDVVSFVATTSLSVAVGAYYGDIDDRVLQLLGITLPDGVDVESGDEVPGLEALKKRISAGKAWQVLLAMTVAAIEEDCGEFTDPPAEYLTQLQSWGYGLSKAEKAIVDAAAKAAKAA